MHDASEVIGVKNLANRDHYYTFRELFRIPRFQLHLSDSTFVHKLVAFSA